MISKRQYDFTKQGQYHKAKRVLAEEKPKTDKRAGFIPAYAIRKAPRHRGAFFAPIFKKGGITHGGFSC